VAEVPADHGQQLRVMVLDGGPLSKTVAASVMVSLAAW
jgi:hypothetical protein